MSKVISGRGKIEFYKEKDKETMDKKYPDVQFEKMNSLTFTTTYKGNELFDLKIKVGDTVIPCSFKKFAWPWKYGSILALEPHFEDLGKKADIRISGGIQGKLFQFFRYDYEKMLKDNPQRQESIKLKSKISKLTNQQKKAIDAHLRQKYSYKKWAESLSDKADPELLKEYNKILKNPDFLENIKKTKKKGGGKTIRVKPEEFKKMISEMEQSVQKDHQKCNNSCYKIKTNFAKDKKKLQLKQKCHHDCWKKRMKTVKAFHKKYPKEFKGFVKSLGGGKKRTIKKSKVKPNANSAYFEFDRFLGKGKFWRITKNGSKITTHYGKIGTLGQMTTKDYGSKVDKKFDSLLKSKKDKGYVEKEYYGHVSESNPKPPTKVEREYLRICKKAEKSKVLNPNAINQDCEAMLDQGESELKWFTGWHKDALKKGEYDWTSYEEHSKSKRKKKKTQKGAGRKLKKMNREVIK